MRRLVIALVLLLAGCGGSDAPDAAPEPPPDAEAEALVDGVELHVEDLGPGWVEEAPDTDAEPDEGEGAGCGAGARGLAASGRHRVFVSPTSYDTERKVISSASAYTTDSGAQRYLDEAASDFVLDCLERTLGGEPVARTEPGRVAIDVAFDDGGVAMRLVARGRVVSYVEYTTISGPVDAELVDHLADVLADRQP